VCPRAGVNVARKPIHPNRNQAPILSARSVITVLTEIYSAPHIPMLRNITQGLDIDVLFDTLHVKKVGKTCSLCL
jgi:hypothetical protein